MVEQSIVFGALVLALLLFVWGKWRYDLVALLALLAVAVTGVVPASEAFLGFGHPAVVTVAAVLVVSRALLNSGVVDVITSWMMRVGERPALQIAALTGLAALLSGFVNNVGALALLMPVAIHMARKSNTSVSLLLMPLAFGSLLGGMTTLIGTPPNIIIAEFRATVADEPFRMFSFMPVGAGVALAGLLFVTLVGWRLMPQRDAQASSESLFRIEDYVAEVRVPEGMTMVGKTLGELEAAVEADVTVLGLVRHERRLPVPSRFEPLEAGDLLVVRVDSEALEALTEAGLELGADEDAWGSEALEADEMSVMEAVIMPRSPLINRTAADLNLRWRYGLNLLAGARQGARLRSRLNEIRFQAGDVLLLQGESDRLQEALADLGCLPLAERELRLGQPRRVILSLSVFGAALIIAALGALPVQLAFVGAAVLMVMLRLLSLREAYDAVDWPVIILLGAMIPVGGALEATGGAARLAGALLGLAETFPAAVTLAVVLVGTMFLSDLVNNAAAAVLMAPIAISVAQGLGASPDPFLMAVAIGASCAFLTPIGHQSNTLVMGPGGYRFSDYWRMGLPLEVVIVITALPLLLFFWPL